MQAGNGVNGRAGGLALVIFGRSNQIKKAPQVRTTDDPGRWGGAFGEEPKAAEPPVLDRARKLFAGLARSLEGEINRLETALNDEPDIARSRSLIETIRMNQKALLLVLDQEARLPGGDTLRPGQDVIDLAEARAEVARRLARLAE
jgi:hypothetical protein